MLNSVSITFHGRDIFTPVAAHIANGVPFEEIGSQISDFVDLDFGRGDIKDNTILGKVIYVDRFGNIITNITEDILPKDIEFNKKIRLSIGKNCIEIPFIKSYGFVKKGEILATIGSSNFLEIGINQGNAAKKLSTKEDDELNIIFN